LEEEDMATEWLREARRRKGWTQHQTASRLGVSQTYLSLLEQGRRPVTKRLLSTLERHLDVPATELPADTPKGDVNAQRLAEALGTLGYPGFGYLKRGRRWNPAQVLMVALQQRDLETRLVEALPWVVLRYPNLDWEWVLDRAKVLDLQNRLGFLLTLARRVAERKGEHETSACLAALEQRLERSRLAREDTLCRESMTTTERRWLAGHRPPEAQHWNLLTDLDPEHLPHAA
jgi:transcriptional regulator with XRE-family HTH domain